MLRISQMITPPELGGGEEIDLVAAVVALDRLQLAHLVALEIRLREYAVSSLARRDDGVGDRPLVEGVRALLADRLQGPGQVRLDQPVADRVGLAVLQEDRRGRGILAEALGARRAAARRRRRSSTKPSRGERDRRAPSPSRAAGCRTRAAPSRSRRPSPARRPRASRRSQAWHHLALGILVHGLGRGQRRLLAEVEEGRPAVGEADGHEAAAAEVARRRIDDRQRVPDRHRRIDGIAALLHDLRSDLGSEVLAGDDHTVVSPDRRRREGQRCARQTQGRRRGDHTHERGHCFLPLLSLARLVTGGFEPKMQQLLVTMLGGPGPAPIRTWKAFLGCLSG